MDRGPDTPLADAERPELAGVARWWELPLVVLDTETTSAQPLEARILQIACCAIYPDGRVSGNSYQAIVNPGPGVEIPADAMAVHGITPARVAAEGVPLVDALFETLRRIARWGKLSPIVIFNAVYDWPLVWEELGRTELVWTDPLADALLLDPLVVEREFNGVAQGHYSNKLVDVAARYGIPIVDAHDATGDAVMTAAILRGQVARYRLLRTLSLAELQHRQRDWYGQWRDSLNAYNAKKGKAWRVAGNWPFGDRRRTIGQAP